MNEVRLQINGKEVSTAEGTTIFEAARSVGIEIPHLCYREDLTPTAACRLCVVEVEGARNLVASCAYPVANNLVVRTNTERVIKTRRLVIELLLSDHPFDCMTCEKSGACELERYAYELGVATTRFQGEKHDYPLDETNPFFVRDYNKCILCERCVKVCSDVQFVEAIDFAHRGFSTKIASPFDRSLLESTCIFCGQCVAGCPVGALTEKSRRFKGREWEFIKVPTVCPYCGVGCNIELNVKDNRIVKVTSPINSVVNKGRLCVKGKFGFDFVHSPERLTTPLIREGEKGEGRFREASWEEALELVARRLAKIKTESGPDSLAILSSAKCTNEENYLMQKFARAVLGTNNIDHCARLCHSPTVAGLATAFGNGAMTNSIAELRDTDCIFIIGSNTSENHPIIALEVMEAVRHGQAKLIVADPRKIRMVDFAHIWLRHKPGTDVALINGMLHIIIAEGWYDADFVQTRTEGFEELKEAVKDYPPAIISQITGVPADDLYQAARLYAQSAKACILFAMGITQHVTGTDNVWALANLAMATGHVGKEGTGVCPLRGQNNVQGACDMGALPNVFPGYQPVTDEANRGKFEESWHVSLPSKPGLTVVEMIHGAEVGKIKSMYIMGEEPVLTDPNSTQVARGLKNLDFLVVQDIFLSETAKFADVVLPAASFAEKDGTFTNTERRIQRVRMAIQSIGDSKPDWLIISEVANRLGYHMEYETPGEIMEEIAPLTPIYAGIHYDRLGQSGLQWPCRTRDDPGTKYLHEGQFSRGLGKFHPTPYREAFELPDETYPFVLSTGRILYHWHGGTMSRRSPGLAEIRPEAEVEINPEDAQRLSCFGGDLVELASRRGKIVAKVKVTDRSPEGVAFMTFHFKEAAANLLTVDALDPVAKIPEFKVCSIQINPSISKEK
ncbi:MAG: formate dehydrogenase subunit alpha [Dehalococcoidia bacterium]|nr:MAG: formate dehydrogenase subunit alpha [Dehalococcoidia bacterium]